MSSPLLLTGDAHSVNPNGRTDPLLGHGRCRHGSEGHLARPTCDCDSRSPRPGDCEDEADRLPGSSSHPGQSIRRSLLSDGDPCAPAWCPSPPDPRPHPR